MKRFTFLFFFVFCLALVAIGQNRYTLVMLNRNPAAPTITKSENDIIMKGHAEKRERLAAEGKLLAAGPFEGGGGMYILNTSSEDDARQWIAEDPGLQAKRWNADVLAYIPRIGGICPVGEKYTMTSYWLVRFDAIVTKATAENFPDIMRQHDEFINQLQSTGNVVTYAVFSDRDGGILIMKGDLQPEVIEADPAVQQGLIQFEIKKFYTARGSFCEE